MKNTAKQKLNRLFYFIAGFAFTAAMVAFWMALRFSSGHQRIPFFLQILTLVLLAQGFGSFGLVRHWFDHFFVRAGKVIDILQWISGFLSVVSIFDLFMKFTSGQPLIFDAPLIFVLDVLFIILFIFWMAVSYFINKDVKERKVCEFC
jgi:uncharacterized membrane protein